MLPSPPIVPALASARSIMLPASFAACGLLLVLLLLGLEGCFLMVDLDDYIIAKSFVNNAVLCSCDCDSPIDPTAAPSRNPIKVGSDDAVQGSTQTAPVLTGMALDLGLNNHVGLRFQDVGIPQGAQITAAHPPRSRSAS
jgi:hypothetical protein